MSNLSLLGAGPESGAAPFAPTDLSNLFAWWDASNAGSITSSSGLVSQWNDLSGNARHLTQAIGTKQPTTGTRTINSKNALDFDGSTDTMLTAAVTQAQPISACLVVLTDLPADVPQHMALGDPVGEGPTVYTKNAHWAYYSNTTEVDTGIACDASQHCLQVLLSGASSLMQVDGVQVASATGVTGWSANAIPVGANATPANFWDGLIAEMIIYAGDKTANFATIRTYLKNKWGTP